MSMHTLQEKPSGNLQGYLIKWVVEDGKNYGDFLLDTIETAKEQFADKEYGVTGQTMEEMYKALRPNEN